MWREKPDVDSLNELFTETCKTKCKKCVIPYENSRFYQIYKAK